MVLCGPREWAGQGWGGEMVVVTLGALPRRHKWAEMFWPFLIFPWALGQRFKCSVIKKDYFSHGKQGHGEQAFPGPDKSLSRRAVSVSFCRVTDHPKT